MITLSPAPAPSQRAGTRTFYHRSLDFLHHLSNASFNCIELPLFCFCSKCVSDPASFPLWYFSFTTFYLALTHPDWLDKVMHQAMHENVFDCPQLHLVAWHLPLLIMSKHFMKTGNISIMCILDHVLPTFFPNPCQMSLMENSRNTDTVHVNIWGGKSHYL